MLPAYLFGMVIAGLFVHDKVLIHRMRTIVFALLTPFFFLKAGTLVSLPALIAGFGLLVILFGVKMVGQDRRRLAHVPPFQDTRARDQLHHPDDGHRPHLRQHLGAVRV